MIKIATRNKKIPRFWHFKQLCARPSYVCRHGLYVVYIVTQTPSFRRSRDLDKSNKFRQMQKLTNDYYSEIKLHNIFHIAYKAIEFSTNIKEPTIDDFRGACAVKGNVQVAGRTSSVSTTEMLSTHDVTLRNVDGSLFHVQI